MSGHKCGGLHCGGCGRGSGGRALIAAPVALIVLVIAGILGDPAARHAAGDAVHVAEIVLVSAAALAAFVGLAALTVPVALAALARHRRAKAPYAVVTRPRTPEIPGSAAMPGVAGRAGSDRPAISAGPVRVLFGIDAEGRPVYANLPRPGQRVAGFDSLGRPVYTGPGCGDPLPPNGTDAHLAIGADTHRDTGTGRARLGQGRGKRWSRGGRDG